MRSTKIFLLLGLLAGLVGAGYWAGQKRSQNKVKSVLDRVSELFE